MLISTRELLFLKKTRADADQMVINERKFNLVLRLEYVKTISCFTHYTNILFVVNYQLQNKTSLITIFYVTLRHLPHGADVILEYLHWISCSVQ